MHSVSKKQVRINLGEADQFPEREWTRRKILKVISAAGVGSAVFGRGGRALRNAHGSTVVVVPPPVHHISVTSCRSW